MPHDADDDADADPAPRDAEPLVTIGIPTFNRVGLLQKAVESCLRQNLPLRIVIADNASGDDTSTYVAELCQSRSNIHYHRHPTNIGPTANANWILGQITTPYFAWLGDDDEYGDNYIAPLLDQVQNDNECVGAIGRVVYVNGDRQFDAVGLDNRGARAEDRVKHYWKTVKDNAGFLALYRTADVIAGGPYRNMMGEDMVRAAALVQRGHLVQLDGATLFRGVGGATSSLRNVANVNGLGFISKNAPQVVIAVNAARDLIHNPVYGRWGFRRIRLMLAVEVTIIRRMVVPGVVKFVRTRAWRSPQN